jgi:ABC-2 type transport system ATP-binding protein
MLKVEGLSFRYPGGDAPVLRELSIEVPSGGIFGLLGPNGAGKTTLISILAGQLRAPAGRITFGGVPLEELRRREPASFPSVLGLVPQEFAFYPMLSCAENLRFFAAVQGLGGERLRERVAAVAAFARIENVQARRAGELSGGLRRRLNLAIGLLTEPRVLLLDEPTVGVDPQSRAFLLESIRGLAAAGRSIVYTSHYMEEIEAICDHVAIIDGGRVLRQGALSELLRDDAALVPVRHENRSLEQLFMHLTSRSLRD